MSYLAKLKSAQSLSDVAALLKVQPQHLAYILYKTPIESRYTSFSVPKKSGRMRTIAAPNARLKLIQVRLRELLEECQLEVEKKLTVKQRCTLAHGFKKGLSTKTNAARHRNKRWVFNIDLKDFFPSVNFGRVYGFFLKNENYSLGAKTAAVLAQIACHKNELPQGSPCSPIVSNMIAGHLDIRLNELATRHGCSYTRYADDLTFSTNERAFPSSIAKSAPKATHNWSVGAGLAKRISKAGFEINTKKVRMQYKDSRQVVTGLVVNEKINVDSEYYKRTRAMCWELFKTGTAYKSQGDQKTPLSTAELRGRMAYIYHIKRSDAARRNDSSADIEKSCFHRTYEELLNFLLFFGQSKPTIICEGKTDNVYLKCALRSLGGQYPDLVQGAGSQREYLLQFFNFTETAKLVQKITGGASQLSNILSSYRRMGKNFNVRPTNPTIIIVDNDSGPEKLFKHLSNILKSEVDGSEQFYYAYENLYVVPVPKIGGTFTAMEKLFDDAVLSKKLNGRILDLTNKETDPSKFYSKNEFSIEVVQKEQSSIDFSGFKPLLDAILAAKADYATKMAVTVAAS